MKNAILQFENNLIIPKRKRTRSANYLNRQVLILASISAVLILLLFSSCEKSKEFAVPECISSMIRDNSFACPVGGSVDQYLFQGEDVYVFSPGYCVFDAQAIIYSHSCKVIGYLGGIAGNNIVNNVLFTKNARFKKNLWKN